MNYSSIRKEEGHDVEDGLDPQGDGTVDGEDGGSEGKGPPSRWSITSIVPEHDP